MSGINLTKKAEPSSPASNTLEIFMDTLDNQITSRDYNGVVTKLGGNEERAKNILINGGFMIQQKVAVGSTAIAGVSTTTRAGVVADRWSVTTDVASNINWQQVDSSGAVETALNSRYYGSVISATAGKKVMISQFIIASEMAHIRGRKVRLSCKLKQKVGSAGQTYKLGLIQLGSAGTVDAPPAFLSGAWSAVTGTDPVFSTNTAAVVPETWGNENGTYSGSYLNITATAGWVRSSGVWTIPTDAKGLYFVIFANADGGTTDNISFAECKLHQGIVIEEFVEEPFDLQYIKCQSYFSKSFPPSTVPAQNVGSGGIFAIAGKAGVTALAGNIGIKFPVEMRVAPTITLYCPTEASAQVDRLTGTTPIAHTATATADITIAGLYVTSTGTTNTAVGDVIGVHYAATAEIIV